MGMKGKRELNQKRERKDAPNLYQEKKKKLPWEVQGKKGDIMVNQEGGGHPFSRGRKKCSLNCRAVVKENFLYYKQGEKKKKIGEKGAEFPSKKRGTLLPPKKQGILKKKSRSWKRGKRRVALIVPMGKERQATE